MKNIVLILTHPHVETLHFIFETQMKIFSMKSERFTYLHWHPMQLPLRHFKKLN